MDVAKFKFEGSEMNQKLLMGHPSGLFVLFFTEMWERFSYYGMRALLVLFLTSALLDGGWAWSREEALGLYGTYTMLVYFSPILGGLIADKFMGYRYAVALGALIMTLGHASMAMDTPWSLYLGIGCLVAGNGLFKPNITSIINGVYINAQDKKDGAFTIFYMGVNAGAFLGIMLCGYIGETVGWHWGFGLAGVFMFLGMLQFWFAQGIFGNVGLPPTKKVDVPDAVEDTKEEAAAKVVSNKVQRDRYTVVGILAVFTVFFWAAFEQAGGSMTIFAADYTNRVLEGDSAFIFRIANTLLTVVPLIIITYVLLQLFKITFKKYALSNTFLGLSFLIIWILVLWMLYTQFNEESTEIPASWFGILNSFYIIAFAPLFSKIWESKFNPPATVKFGVGLILLGLGFGILAYGSASIPQGAQTASVSVIWLILAYLLHTLGELSLSPVGLSYVSKLVPATKIGMMFGLWYIAIGLGNKAAGSMGGMIDTITSEYSMSTFFLLFTFIPILAGLIVMSLTPIVKKLMHGVR
ncbi:MAG: peptide MFS transporter [Flavobacteriaceae bacterium]|jgi:POT family proton-dependent oligopeptide transporter|nr:peptide MFS transporter [Flavobacteriaceae bacterium]MBT6705641.1 peptide MFS transporter [Flavobacteriaceae bacterium]|tara:strand:+ start:31 stop:1602 length:1572 start_codon:yes stop_codon:yes gene_type:complete